jgi:glycoside/pentoside/hexuronide:cation symporter, GPH family
MAAPIDAPTLSTAVNYGLSAGAVSFLVLPFFTVMAAIYAKYFGLRFEDIGVVFFVNDCLVAIASPAIGLMADKHRSCGGARKLWVLTSLFFMGIAAYGLLMPPPRVTVTYLLGWSVALNLFRAAYDISHLAWGSELSSTYHGSTRLLTVRSVSSSLGAIAFYVMPLLPLFDTREVTPEVLRCAAIVATVLMLSAGLFTFRYLREGEYRATAGNDRLGDAIKYVFCNRPFLLLSAVNVLFGMANGMWVTLSFAVYDYYYGVGSVLSATYIVSYVVTAVSLPLFEKVCRLKGKKVALVVLQVVFMALITLPACVEPGKGSYVPLALALIGVQAVLICNFTVSGAILVDAIDYGHWKHGSGHAAGYISMSSTLSGVATSVGGSVGLFVIGHLGFSPTGISNWQDAGRAIRFAFYDVPLLLTLSAVIFTLKLPISAARSGIIRRRLNARRERRSGVPRPALDVVVESEIPRKVV